MSYQVSSRRMVRLAALAALAVAVYLLANPLGPQKPSAVQGDAAKTAAAPAPKALPRMVDLGKTWCIPCKMMVAVLEEAQTRYKGKATIEFIDLDKRPEAAQEYKIMVIPTQVFFTADGKEFERHVGYLPFEEVEKIFTKMGVERSS
jgi:thioredoxin 1